ncbi:MAG: hypothetical protein ACOX5Z_00830 [Desulfobulbus sp.]|jgi:hypothetical protein
MHCRFLVLLPALLLLLSLGPQAHAALHITIGDSAFYGLLDMAGFSNPRFINPNPIIIDKSGLRMGRGMDNPLYLRVPLGHLKKWSKHCHKYNACNRPVYFVDENWYQNTYAPQYRKRAGYRDGDRRDYDRRYWKDDDDDDDDNDDDRRRDRRRSWKDDDDDDDDDRRDRWRGKGHGRKDRD